MPHPMDEISWPVTLQCFSMGSHLHFPHFLAEEGATENVVCQQILHSLKQAGQPLLASPQK